ncbi:MAG: hypothetical protein HS119_12730 [Flavobacteriales bacterium]|nr:hypothetical protein [Flavobacteriales bacterium]
MKIENRILWTLIGIGAGHLIGRALGETEEEKQELSRKGRWIGGIGSFGLTFAFDKPKDTVNYTLKHNGKRVYDGITKEYRIDTRISEHKASGKIFNEVVFDNPKPITDAKQLEVYRIKRFKPKYNIQHNSL